MSQAGKIQELAPKFLRVAYEIGINEPSDIVMLDQMAEHIDQGEVGATGGQYVDTMTTVAQYLGSRGFLKRQSSDWGMFSVIKEGMDEVEGRNEPPQPSVTNTWNLSGNFYQSAIGTHNTNTFSGDLDFSTVEQRIEEEGGTDKEELREMVAEMRGLLERGETLDRGFLVRWNDKLQRYEWLTNAVAGWLLNFSTSGL